MLLSVSFAWKCRMGFSKPPFIAKFMTEVLKLKIAVYTPNSLLFTFCLFDTFPKFCKTKWGRSNPGKDEVLLMILLRRRAPIKSKLFGCLRKSFRYLFGNSRILCTESSCISVKLDLRQFPYWLTSKVLCYSIRWWSFLLYTTLFCSLC